MIYRVSHLTEYLYEAPVSSSHHQLHLLPRVAGRQVNRWEELSVDPTPARQHDHVDYFGNRATHLEILEPHRRLAVLSRSEIEILPVPVQMSMPLPMPTSIPTGMSMSMSTSTPAGMSMSSAGMSLSTSMPMSMSSQSPAPAVSPPWEVVRDRVRQAHAPDQLEVYELAFASPYVSLSPGVADFAAQSFTPGRPIVDAAIDLMHRIHADFIYDSEATKVSTPVDEVLAHRRGVCQDFAHLALACLRVMGLPGRYVSGYLVTAIPGQPRLVGADASHAWLQVYSPDVGWIDLDPTNDVVPTDKHITVAYGRDFGDVTPLRGVIMGGGRHELRVVVDVVPVPAEPDSGV